MSNPSFSLLQGDPATWPTPPAGKTLMGINAAGAICLKQSDGSVIVVLTGSPSYNAQATSAGAIVVSPRASVHTEVLTITGGARTSNVNLLANGLPDGSRCVILFKLPATAGIILEVFDAGTATLLSTIDNETAAVLKASTEYVLSGGIWSPLRELIPAFTPVS